MKSKKGGNPRLHFIGSEVKNVNSNMTRGIKKLLARIQPQEVVSDALKYEKHLKDTRKARRKLRGDRYNLKELDDRDVGTRGRSYDQIRSDVKAELTAMQRRIAFHYTKRKFGRLVLANSQTVLFRPNESGAKWPPREEEDQARNTRSSRTPALGSRRIPMTSRAGKRLSASDMRFIIQQEERERQKKKHISIS